ncbi:FecCD family ABC transporter permease [Streptoalloteichus tenebrarius]|uniref:FecCD family ABC transporter permease n=1 Tax=Streptoalloteichus tenebrarius (strain ATCC 17920 / DSM 40477 / JCM 4838 / CBS 697.72 / NBRC 16177 / NCIMB 11028 / NRRL B-12390 / A12253. 1 / ISP 5477) TaxID=1933 RepID=UPI0020A51518|nr:iron chelate uptake ABC transporter family permease subunit [Streptoalloteichus tenebrarius]BFF01570.1 iron chelate uptake ABC transporter family permease subunit [Streptoalloteichus tenebrarius]
MTAGARGTLGLETASSGGPERVPGRPPLRVGPASWVLRARALAVPLVGLAVVVLLMAVNIGRGEFPLSVTDVLNVLVGGGDRPQRFIVLDLRLPRSLTGALVGAALGLSGALTQTITRNPLATPDITGITAGAGAAAVSVIVVGGSYGSLTGQLAEIGVPLAGLVGGLLSAILVYLLAWQRGVEGYRLVLVGLGAHALLSSLTYWLLTLGDVTDASRAVVWLTGSLNGRGWEHVTPVAIALAVLVPLTLLGAHALGALQMGDDTARGLGVRVNLTRALLLLAAVALAAVATAAAGPVAFVALATPQIAMRLSRTAQPPMIASAVLGAVLTVGSDLVARTAFGAVELPVGIITAVLGAPYLMYLLVRRYREVRA